MDLKIYWWRRHSLQGELVVGGGGGSGRGCRRGGGAGPGGSGAGGGRAGSEKRSRFENRTETQLVAGCVERLISSCSYIDYTVLTQKEDAVHVRGCRLRKA